LAGRANPTTWRKDVAIPRLKQHDVTYYNPQIENWTPDLIEVEEIAKENAQIKFFVIDKMTRGISSMVEIAYLAATRSELMVVLEDFDEDAVFDGHPVQPRELADLNRGHDVLCTFLYEKGIPLFDDISTALDYTVMLATRAQSIHQLHGDVYVAEPVIRGTDLSQLSKAGDIFDQYDCDGTGHLSVRELQLALRSFTRAGIPEDELMLALDACAGGSIAAHMSRTATASDDGTLGASAGEPLFGFSGGMPKNSRLVSRSDFYAIVAGLLHGHRKEDLTPLESLYRRFNPFAEAEPLDLSIARGVFLGGSIGDRARWRERRAIPLLRNFGVDFFNPNLVQLCAQLTPREAQAKRLCNVLLFFVSKESRDIPTMVEAAHFLGEGRDVVLCVEHVEPSTYVDDELISPRAAKDINRGRHYLADVAVRVGAPVFTVIEDAVHAAIKRVREIRATSGQQ